MKKITVLALILIISVFIFSCKKEKVCCEKNKSLVENTKISLQHVEWSCNAIIYEVNLRQHTEEGTFNAFAEHLPRLKEMGVNILWLMPINPISKKKRKGTLGSYYAVGDYKKTNPEFGSIADLKSLVNKAHELDMYVILDWVANHTGWDNPWIENNPEWFTQNEKGEVIDPINTETGESWGWTDVADLNYDSKEMRAAMIDALKFWITEADVDGYRCDVAHGVPVDFWNDAREELDKIKPVFMLAEAEIPALLEKAFDMDYAWEFHHIMNEVARGKKDALDFDEYFAKADTLRPKDSYVMNFVTNHDENSWAGTIGDRFGDGAKAFTVLTYTLPGMPLIYSGQEAGLDRKLEFFEKDVISWENKNLMPFYIQLGKLKRGQDALNNGTHGGELQTINTSNNVAVYAYYREKDESKVVVVLNLTHKVQEIVVDDEHFGGKYTNFFSGEAVNFKDKTDMKLEPWDYRVFVK